MTRDLFAQAREDLEWLAANDVNIEVVAQIIRNTRLQVVIDQARKQREEPEADSRD